jgi:hypothetical protein
MNLAVPIFCTMILQMMCHLDNQQRNVTVGFVQEGDIGDQDDDDDEDSTRDVPVLNRTPRLLDHIQPRRRRTSMNNDSDDTSNSSRSVDDTAQHESNKWHRSQSPASKTDIQCMHCDSLMDVVTDEDLPDLHVCFFSSGQSK